MPAFIVRQEAVISPVFALSKLQESRNVCAPGTVERASGRAGRLGRLPLEGSSLIADLEQELGLVAFEVDAVGDGNRQQRALDDFGARAKFGHGKRLGDVRKCVFPLSRDCRGGREHQNADAQYSNPAHRTASSFDFDAHHAVDARDQQGARPYRPYDWGLEHAGRAYHVEPASERIPADLDPHLTPATVRPLIRLDDGREPRLDYLRSMMAAMMAIVFFAAIGGATLYAAAVRLPAVHQASLDAEGV